MENSLKIYLAYKWGSPYWMYRLNQKLSYASYRQILRSAVESIGADPSLFGFHSCRSGGATDLASNLTPFELLSAGRWQSQQSLAHYVEIPKSRKLQWSKFLDSWFSVPQLRSIWSLAYTEVMFLDPANAVDFMIWIQKYFVDRIPWMRSILWHMLIIFLRFQDPADAVDILGPGDWLIICHVFYYFFILRVWWI